MKLSNPTSVGVAVTSALDSWATVYSKMPSEITVRKTSAFTYKVSGVFERGTVRHIVINHNR